MNTASADEVGIKVHCRDAVSVTQLRIWMLPPSYWEPPILKTCNELFVEESTSGLINKAVLEVSFVYLLLDLKTHYNLHDKL